MRARTGGPDGLPDRAALRWPDAAALSTDDADRLHAGAELLELCRQHFPQLASGEASLTFHVYGRDAVMGDMEPLRHVVPHEVGLMGEVTAPTQALANDICSSTRMSAVGAKRLVEAAGASETSG
jgi:hypothetical protein